MRRALFVSLVIVAGCPKDEPAAGAAPKPRGVADPKATIEEAKRGAERANEAAQERNDEAFDRAMQGEAPAERSVPR